MIAMVLIRWTFERRDFGREEELGWAALAFDWASVTEVEGGVVGLSRGCKLIYPYSAGVQLL